MTEKHLKTVKKQIYYNLQIWNNVDNNIWKRVIINIEDNNISENIRVPICLNIRRKI